LYISQDINFFAEGMLAITTYLIGHSEAYEDTKEKNFSLILLGT
jgi:hypothetical protein